MQEDFENDIQGYIEACDMDYGPVSRTHLELIRLAERWGTEKVQEAVLAHYAPEVARYNDEMFTLKRWIADKDGIRPRT